MENTEILTLDEVSKYLKIPKGTLYKMCQSSRIPSFKAGKQLRFRKSAIDRWVINQEKRRKQKRVVSYKKKITKHRTRKELKITH